MAAKESQAKHIVAQPFVQINGKRAVSEASLILLVRGGNGHLEIDLTTYARFYDLLEKREGGWRIIKRTAIYEKDRMDCVQPMTYSSEVSHGQTPQNMPANVLTEFACCSPRRLGNKRLLVLLRREGFFIVPCLRFNLS